MDRRFDDDRKERVVTSDGRNAGRVRGVDNDWATVERPGHDENPTDGIEEQLVRSDEDETHELRRDHVDRYDDTEHHLQPRR